MKHGFQPAYERQRFKKCIHSKHSHWKKMFIFEAQFAVAAKVHFHYDGNDCLQESK